ncbi:MAG: hypothetical protein ACE5KT_02870 [Methanosarcinales archaeon]
MDLVSPYANANANAKALAALHFAEKVSLTAATGHEVMGVAARLADEARDSRKPHARSGV